MNLQIHSITITSLTYSMCRQKREKFWIRTTEMNMRGNRIRNCYWVDLTVHAVLKKTHSSIYLFHGMKQWMVQSFCCSLYAVLKMIMVKSAATLLSLNTRNNFTDNFPYLHVCYAKTQNGKLRCYPEITQHCDLRPPCKAEQHCKTNWHDF